MYDDHEYEGWGKTLARAAAIIVGLVLIILACTPDWARAAGWQQPYGGCDEAWQAPRSAGAQACRDHGWTVTSHLVLSQHKVVRWSNLESCRFEDGSGRQQFPCSWNFPPGGGHDGASYYLTGNIDHHHAHFVWPYGVARERGWRWVTSGVADALAESDAPRATTRDWSVCRFNRQHSVVKCPTGFRWSW